MISFGANAKVYLAAGVTDMRKSIDGSYTDALRSSDSGGQRPMNIISIRELG